MSFKLNDVDHFIGVQQPRRNDRIVENGTLTILPGGDYELAIKGESQCQNSTIINEPPASVKLHHIPGKVIKNQSATLICTVEDHLPKSQPKNVTYIWYKGQYRISDVTSSNLTIQRASLETRGNYTCVAQNELGQSSPATIFVDVLAPPALIEAPPPYKGVLYSTRDVSLTCRFECYPICSVEWFKNGDPILIDKNDNTKSLYTVNERVHLADYNRNYFESIESTLIWNMTNWPNQVLDPSEQLSVYTCSSRSKAGAQIGTEKDASTEIAVDFPPRNITVSHTIVNVVENQFPIAVKCRGNGKPNPNYVWKRSFQLGFKSPPISHQSILQLGPMSRKEAGVYVCEVSNKYGRRDAKVHFNVLYAPECGIVFTQRRGKLALKCTAQGNPQTLDYTWKIVRSPGTINTKNVISTPTDSYLILDPTVRADRYYQCTANNSVGMGVPCERYVPASRHLEPKTPNSKPEISQLDSSENAHTVDTAGPGGHFEPTPSVPENTYDIESVQPVGPFEPSPGPPKNTQTTDRVRPADHFEPNPGPPGFSENTYEADRVRPGGHFEPNPGLPGPSENTYETDRVRPGGQFEPYPGTPGYYIPDYSQQEHPFWSSTTSKPRPGGIFGHLLPTSRPHFQRPGGFNINIQLPILNRGQPRNNGGLFSGGIGFL